MKSIVRTLSTYVILKGKNAEVPPIESIPIPGAKSVPAGRFVAAYGNQGTLKMFQELRRKVAADKVVRRVDIKIDVGNAQNPMVTMGRLAQSKTIHLNKLSVDLREYIRALLQVPEQNTISQLIAFDPARLNILWEDPLLSHLSVICWQHPTRTNPHFQLGAIASPNVVDEVVILNHPFPVELNLLFF